MSNFEPEREILLHRPDFLANGYSAHESPLPIQNMPYIVKSPTMVELFERAQRMAKYPSTVLIEGETGVGKEVLANWIHQNSSRSNMPFTKVNCASIPESLWESELFGYERGAFTGAKREGHAGLFELSDKGTLLLDEISELPASMQAKLLRVLQEREVRRVGGSWSKVIDVRILACTNQDLRGLVQKGKFREDLFYRLHVATLHVPALRQRRMDIGPLLTHFLQRISTEFGIQRHFSPNAFSLLCNYNYPGNVRELRNLVEGIMISVEKECIDADDLPAYLSHPSTAQPQPVWAEVLHSGVAPVPRPLASQGPTSLQQQLDETERNLIQVALDNATSIRHAAKALGISHSTLLRKLTKHNMRQP